MLRLYSGVTRLQLTDCSELEDPLRWDFYPITAFAMETMVATSKIDRREQGPRAVTALLSLPQAHDFELPTKDDKYLMNPLYKHIHCPTK